MELLDTALLNALWPPPSRYIPPTPTRRFALGYSSVHPESRPKRRHNNTVSRVFRHEPARCQCCLHHSRAALISLLFLHQNRVQRHSADAVQRHVCNTVRCNAVLSSLYTAHVQVWPGRTTTPPTFLLPHEWLSRVCTMYIVWSSSFHPILTAPGFDIQLRNPH